MSKADYDDAVNSINFELGAIAYHCHQAYLNNPNAFDSYIPTSMIGATNDFYNFMIDSFSVFKKDDGTTLKAAWEMYKTYCEETKVPYPFSQRNSMQQLMTIRESGIDIVDFVLIFSKKI